MFSAAFEALIDERQNAHHQAKAPDGEQMLACPTQRGRGVPLRPGEPAWWRGPQPERNCCGYERARNSRDPQPTLGCPRLPPVMRKAHVTNGGTSLPTWDR